MLCSALFSFACLAMLGFALLCYVWLCLGWLCFADAAPGTAKILVRKNQAFPDIAKTEVRTNWAFPNIRKLVVCKLPVYFSRAGIVHTASFSSRNAAYLQLAREKAIFWSQSHIPRENACLSPLCGGGAQLGPKNEKLRKEYNRKPLLKIQAHFSDKSAGNVTFRAFHLNLTEKANKNSAKIVVRTN